jgi:hypothetical protein
MSGLDHRLHSNLFVSQQDRGAEHASLVLAIHNRFPADGRCAGFGAGKIVDAIAVNIQWLGIQL